MSSEPDGAKPRLREALLTGCSRPASGTHPCCKPVRPRNTPRYSRRVRGRSTSSARARCHRTSLWGYTQPCPLHKPRMCWSRDRTASQGRSRYFHTPELLDSTRHQCIDRRVPSNTSCRTPRFLWGNSFRGSHRRTFQRWNSKHCRTDGRSICRENRSHPQTHNKCRRTVPCRSRYFPRDNCPLYSTRLRSRWNPSGNRGRIRSSRTPAPMGSTLCRSERGLRRSRETGLDQRTDLRLCSSETHKASSLWRSRCHGCTRVCRRHNRHRRRRSDR
jgi:hypothetical protein